ncbi:hypothetical protein SORBI_3006G055501 [Sorghum bicolor]|nr:hypothetical protein SORBI_3006G055501 [Sorghum bicolor]
MELWALYEDTACTTTPLWMNLLRNLINTNLLTLVCTTGMWWKGVAGIDGEDGSVNRHRSSVPAGLVLYSKNHRAHQHQGIKVSAVQQMERRKVLQSGLALVEGLAMVLRTTRKKKLVSG